AVAEHAIGLYRADRTGTLGDAAARPGDREPRLRGGTGAVGTPRQWPRNLRRQPDRGLLGPGAVAPYQRRRGGHCRAGPGRAGGSAPQFSRLDASAVVSVNSKHMAASTTALTFDPLRYVREGILAPAGLDVGRVEQALGLVLGSAVDSADLYFQLSREESWALEDGIVKEGNSSIEQGVGVRAMAGEKTGFAYSDEIMLPALEEAARAAPPPAAAGGEGAVQP